MKKVLLVDSSFSAVPIYQYLCERGFEVYVCGANPADPLAKWASNFILLDYSCIDALRELINRLKVQYLIPGCNDVSYHVCASLNEGNRFCGIDDEHVSSTINSKDKFRMYAISHDIPVPSVFKSFAEIEKWPIIVKPTDAYSGRGISVLKYPEQAEIKNAIEQALDFSRTKSYIIEEYVEGQLYSHSAFISNEMIVTDFVVKEFCSTNPFAVDTSYVSRDFPSDVLDRIRKMVCSMCSDLKLKDGLVHTQFIMMNYDIYFIEVTRRCPGDLYSKLIEDSTGFAYAEAYAKPFIGETATAKDAQFSSNILRHTISCEREQIYNELQFNSSLNIRRFVPISLTGDVVKSSPFGRIGILFLEGNSTEDVSILADYAINKQLYRIQ